MDAKQCSSGLCGKCANLVNLLSVSVMHTSASLTINENASPDVPLDLNVRDDQGPLQRVPLFIIIDFVAIDSTSIFNPPSPILNHVFFLH